MIRAIIVVGIAATACPAFGQSVVAPLRFEVASIKPTQPTLDGRYAIRERSTPGRLDYSAVSLKTIIQRACEVREFQVSGPDWIASTRFDIAAKLPSGAPASKVPEMLRTLLAERFHMTVHRETKDMPGYALVVDKNGPRMKVSAVDPNTSPSGTGGGRGAPVATAEPTLNGGARAGGRTGTVDCGPERDTPPSSGWMMNKGPGKLEGHMMNMVALANALASQLRSPVVDQTGLQGSYDFDLDYAPDQGQLPPPGEVPVPDDPRVSLLKAVQMQLGLKLRARKAPVKVIVVDQSDKAPTEN